MTGVFATETICSVQQGSALSDYDIVDQAVKLFEQSKEVPPSVMRMR